MKRTIAAHELEHDDLIEVFASVVQQTIRRHIFYAKVVDVETVNDEQVIVHLSSMMIGKVNTYPLDKNYQFSFLVRRAEKAEEK